MLGPLTDRLSGFLSFLGRQLICSLLLSVLFVISGLLLLLNDFLSTSFALEHLAAEELVLSLLPVGS